MPSSNGSRPSKPSVAIVGAGFGGIGLGIRLKQAGLDSFTILEKADRVGGVWRDNTYPGLTCDIPSHLYSFSFEPKHDWSRRFPKRDEILAYLERCTEKYGIEGHLRLGTEVESADFDEERGRWRIRTTDGEELEADVLVSATGQLSRPVRPSIPGIDRFEGPVFHSARWDHDVELDGKRVAVVGTGASSIQFVPEIAPRVERLTLFQRSPPWVIPKPDRPYAAWQKRLFRRLPWIQSLSRALVYLRFELVSLILTRLRPLARPIERMYERQLREEIADPSLRAKLLPDYPLGCKRVLISNDWLPTLARANVEVVTDPISELSPNAIVTADGDECPADVVILGTGFAAHDFLAPMRISGLGGRDLNESWRDGAEAYLGLAVAGFPNMFILYGPNTNLGAGSIVAVLESQIGYVVQAARALQRTGARWIEVRDDVQSAFNDDLQRRLAGSVWTAGCSNWYRSESGKVTNNWPGLTSEYRRLIRRPNPTDFQVAPPLE
jgi:cation diffusion facilitator CzcD-associated flavoprotein CzcO